MYAKSIRVHIMHSEALLSAGLHAFLSEQTDWVVTTDARTPQARNSANVIVSDHDMGILLARQSIRRNTAVLVITPLEKEWDVQVALDNGVQGYLLQSCCADEVVHAIRALVNGQRYLSSTVAERMADSKRRIALTARQIDVLQLLGEGCCNKQIARRLGIGVGTVKSHVKAVMQRLDATARTHAVVVATQRGLITPGQSDVSRPSLVR